MDIIKQILFGYMALALTPSASLAAWFGPDNYEECILESMKGVTSDTAAREIRSACHRKFSKQTSNKIATDLSAYELSRITGTGEVYVLSDGDYFRVELYNGNGDITIDKLTIRLIAINGKTRTSNDYEYDLHTAGNYGVLKPHSTRVYSTRILKWPKGAKSDWSIITAVGTR